jgi:hypothetical protein
MPNSDPDSASEAFRYDLVAYLAQRFGVAQEEALDALGDWLVSFEPRRSGVRRKVPFKPHK